MDPQEPISEAVVEAQKAEAEPGRAIQRIAEAAVEAPAAEAVVEAPNVEAVAEEPNVEAVAEKPNVEAVAEEPNVEAVAEAPNDEAVAEEPNVEAVAEEPNVEAVAEEPNVEAVAAAPNAVAVAETTNAEAAGPRRDSLLIMKETLRNMQKTEKTVVGEIKSLQEEKDTLENFLRSYHQIKTDFLDTLSMRRNKARKVVAASLAVSLSSFTVGLRCSAKAAFRDAMPWTIGIGATSLAFSLVFSKDVWLSFRDYSWWKNMRLPVMGTQSIPDNSIEDPIPEIMLLHISMPDCFAAFCVGDKELETRRRRRIYSI